VSGTAERLIHGVLNRHRAEFGVLAHRASIYRCRVYIDASRARPYRVLLNVQRVYGAYEMAFTHLRTRDQGHHAPIA
jgi:hypothetical protein